MTNKSGFAGEGLDSEGYIITIVGADKIPAYAQGMIAQICDEVQQAFPRNVHSLYLYGSMATGLAKPPGSDVDLIIVIEGDETEELRWKLSNLGDQLSDRYRSLVREVGMSLFPRSEAIRPESLYSGGCFLKHLSACIRGEDITAAMPRLKPCIEISRGFNGDYAAEVAKSISHLSGTGDPETILKWCRRLSRKTIRTGFSLVMPRAQCWITDLARSCEVFEAWYPEHRETMRRCLVWSCDPIADAREVIDAFNAFSPWLEGEFQSRIGMD